MWYIVPIIAHAIIGTIYSLDYCIVRIMEHLSRRECTMCSLSSLLDSFASRMSPGCQQGPSRGHLASGCANVHWGGKSLWNQAVKPSCNFEMQWNYSNWHVHPQSVWFTYVCQRWCGWVWSGGRLWRSSSDSFVSRRSGFDPTELKVHKFKLCTYRIQKSQIPIPIPQYLRCLRVRPTFGAPSTHCLYQSVSM